VAKPFYSIEEVCSKLGKSEDAVKAMVRGGQLREFRDAGKVFFKAEEVDRLAGGGKPSISAADEELPDLGKGGTSVIGLEPLDDEPEKPQPKAPPPRPSPAAAPPTMGVLDDDEVEIDADPMAKTQITAAASDDQLRLEGTGSGSGLLDLTREADDTSLGAELLDEIYPGEEEAAAPRPAAQPRPAAAAPEPTPAEPEPALTGAETGTVLAPVVVSTADPTEGLFAGLAVGSMVVLAIGGSVVAGAMQGFMPSYGQWLANNFLLFLGGAALVPIVALLVGWLIGRGR